MTSFLLNRDTRSAVHVGWAVLGVALGLVMATQPIPVIAVVILVAGFFVLSAFTPVAALVFVVILAPLRTLIATESSFQLPLDIGQITLIGFVAAWLLHHIVMTQSLPRIRWTPIYIPLMMFLVVTGLTAFNAWSLGAWLNEWLKWLQITLIVVMTLILAPGRRWQWLVAILVVAGCANALVGLYQFLGGSGALHLLINDRFFRAFGTFGQPNPFGGFMGLLAPLAMSTAAAYGLRWWQTRKNREAALLLFYTICSLLLLLGLIISWSRGAWLAIVAAIAVMIFALPRQTHRGLLLAAVLGITLGTLWFSGLLPESIVTRISSSTEEFFAFEDVRGVDITAGNYAVVERLAHWQAAFNMVAANPWLGVGFGNYEVAYPYYRLINWHEPLGHAHNYYLNIFAETGLAGLLAYGNVWVIIIGLTWRARRHPDILSRFVIIGLMGSWTYLTVHSLFDNLYVNNLFIHLGIMLGILSTLYNQVSSSIRMRVS